MRALTPTLTIFALVVGLTSVASAQATTEAEARQLLARFDSEPTVNQVQQAALDYAAMHPESFEAMRSRSRYAAALPELRVRVTKDLDDEARSVTTFEDNNQPDKVSATEVRDDQLQLLGEVRWRLGEMVFNARETAVVRENRFAAKERAKLLQTVTQIYFERRRTQIELVQAPPADAASRVLVDLKISQLTGELDGLTGGAFSRMAAGQR